MKKYFLSLLFLFVLFGLHAQDEFYDSDISYELSIGYGKVNFSGTDISEYNLVYCDDCSTQILRSTGHELTSKLTFHKQLNAKHELIGGMGFNFWSYNADVISGWIPTPEENSTSQFIISFVDLIIGHRMTIMESGENKLFYETNVHQELNFQQNEFKTYRLSVEPGIGMQFNLDSGLTLISSISYKQSVRDLLLYEIRRLDQENLSLYHGIVTLKIGVKKNF